MVKDAIVKVNEETVVTDVEEQNMVGGVTVEETTVVDHR